MEHISLKVGDLQGGGTGGTSSVGSGVTQTAKTNGDRSGNGYAS